VKPQSDAYNALCSHGFKALCPTCKTPPMSDCARTGDDDLDSFIAEQMRDPEFARVYRHESRRSDRFIQRRRWLCRIGLHLLSFGDGEVNHCACDDRQEPADV